MNFLNFVVDFFIFILVCKVSIDLGYFVMILEMNQLLCFLHDRYYNSLLVFLNFYLR